jgi:putative oxidoreductase
MNVLLWIAQIILAGVSILAGSMKVFMYESMAAQAPAIRELPHGLVTFIGVAELLGAAGLILPTLLRVKPWLTPLAALLFSQVMLMAIPVHLLHGESIAMNLALCALGAFVAYGRWRGIPTLRPVGARLGSE